MKELDEVLEDGEAFAEVRRDGRLDDRARRLGHQSAHPGELAHLLLAPPGARVGHHENRINSRRSVSSRVISRNMASETRSVASDQMAMTLL